MRVCIVGKDRKYKPDKEKGMTVSELHHILGCVVDSGGGDSKVTIGWFGIQPAKVVHGDSCCSIV